MITTLLADDDKMALDYLEELVKWESYGFRIVGRATSGDDALRLYSRLKPRLIITDVKMPAMNGLDFVAQVRQSDRTTRIIFLSGYQEPAFLLTALRLGVDDYILKHELDEKSLLDKLIKISRDLRSEENNIQLAFGKLVADHLERDSDLPEADNTEIGRLLDRKYQAVLIEEDCILPPAADYFGYKAPTRFLTEIINSVTERSGLPTITIKTRKNRFLILVAPMETASALRATSELHALTRSLQSTLTAQTGSSFSIIFSAEANRPDQLKSVWQRMNECMAAARFFQAGFCYSAEECALCGSAGRPRPMSELEAAVDKGDPAYLRGFLDERIRLLSDARDAVAASIFCARGLELLTRKGNETTDIETGSSFPMPAAGSIKSAGAAKVWLTWNGLMNWVAGQLVRLAALIGKNKSMGYPASVLDAIEFIRGNYSRPDLSVEDIACHIGRGRNRFGLLFKEKTSYTIADYLTRFRIQKALVLISSDKQKMYEISSMVGYTTSQYFSKVFKKVVGMTPYEYKISAAENKEGAGNAPISLETNYRPQSPFTAADD